MRLNVLSLFDGISCGRIALERAGIEVGKYFASEIDKYAIQISKKNYPDIIHIGNVKEVMYKQNDGLYYYPMTTNGLETWAHENIKIDLLIGGSPCQDLSIAKRGGKGLSGEKSGLFYEYIRILSEVQPRYFLLENVASMKKEDKDEITRMIGVEPIMINSALIGAQNRKRLYWTNIPGVIQPEDRGIVLKDILEHEVEEKYYIDPEVFERLKVFESNARLSDIDGKVGALSTMQGGHRQPKVQVIGNVHPSGNGMNGMVYDIGGKAPTVSTNKGEGSKIVVNKNCFYEINKVGKLRQGYEYYKKDAKISALSVAHARNTKVIVEKRIRKLTPIECERLQTLPDNYTAGVSNTQRYKGIGNGWTVDVIKHIFSFIPTE